jgi:membrane protein
VISWVVIAALFATVYRIVPDVDLRWGDVAFAAVVTALLFMIGKQFIGLYFTRSRFASTYSAAGSPIVVLLWVYYCAQLFFWGAEFSKVYTKQIGSQSSLWQ